jgi:C1A family cysteine protease
MRKYGWVPDLRDVRDDKFLLTAPSMFVIPATSNLESLCSRVENQGARGTCTGQAFADAMEMRDRWLGKDSVELSRLFIYYNERLLLDSIYEDSGARIRDGIKALRKWGVCNEELWPYDIDRFTERPPPEAYEDAKSRIIDKYRPVRNLRDVKYALSMGFPVIYGFTVYDSFETEEVFKTGNVPYPKPWERIRGGHANLFVGHNDDRGILRSKNSYGVEFGDKGFLNIPYRFVEEGIASDMWIIQVSEDSFVYEAAA